MGCSKRNHQWSPLSSPPTQVRWSIGTHAQDPRQRSVSPHLVPHPGRFSPHIQQEALAAFGLPTAAAYWAASTGVEMVVVVVVVVGWLAGFIAEYRDCRGSQVENPFGFPLDVLPGYVGVVL